MAKDDLDALIEERSRKNPQFRRRVDEALLRRRLGSKLAAVRERKGLSQTVVAARMETSASVVSKLEGGGDIKLSTLQRYCSAVGTKVPLVL